MGKASNFKGAEQGYGGEVLRPIGPNFNATQTTFDKQVIRKTHPRSVVDDQGTEWWWNGDKGKWER